MAYPWNDLLWRIIDIHIPFLNISPQYQYRQFHSRNQRKKGEVNTL